MVTKTGVGKSKAPGGRSKAPGSRSKAPGGGSKTPGGRSKAPGGRSKAPGGRSKAPGGESKAMAATVAVVEHEVRGVDALSAQPTVPLRPPTRVGRSLKNMVNALDEFEFRLRVAEKYLDVLAPALPGGARFLAVGATAASVLRADPVDVGDGAVARAARQKMVDLAQVVRDVVIRTTRVGAAARDAVLIGESPNPKLFSSVAQCERILAGAKEIRAEFPALTDALLGELSAAVAAAQRVSGERKTERKVKAVDRLSSADQRQLATDVLLDCVDHLAAAALSTMRESHGTVRERLTRALEPESAEDSSGGATPPAT